MTGSNEMSKLERALAERNIVLPPAPAAALYTPVVCHGATAYVSGQLPREGDRIAVTGAVGRDVSVEEARNGARIALIRGLGALRDALGSLDDLKRIVKLTVFVHSAADFTEQSAVADGASQLLFDLFGSSDGAHARSAVGVAQLPRNASVEVELIAEIVPQR
jgi:enamine deaminase RidA (YjgF/YER057c/UK114 family)